MDLLLMASDPLLLSAVCDPSAARDCKLSGVVIDLERWGKPSRQQAARALLGVETTMSQDTLESLQRARRIVPPSVSLICRTNDISLIGDREVDEIVDAGADELLLPMIRSAREVERIMTLVAGRAGVGIMVETPEALERMADLGCLPVSRMYIGLMDLALERRSLSPFVALIDGTVDRIRSAVTAPLGVAGLTVPVGGSPVPSRLIAAELARLGLDFTVLRRSFLSDVEGLDAPAIRGAISSIRKATQLLLSRTTEECEADRRAFVDSVLASMPDGGHR